MSDTGHVRLKQSARVGNREHAAGAVLEVTAEQARELFARGLAVPAAPRGKMLTSPALAARAATIRKRPPWTAADERRHRVRERDRGY